MEPRDCSTVVLSFCGAGRGSVVGWLVGSVGAGIACMHACMHTYMHTCIHTRRKVAIAVATHARVPMLRQMKSTEMSPSEYSGDVSTRHTVVPSGAS